MKTDSRFLFEFPHFVPLDAYERELNRCVDRLSMVNGVKSIYQIGGVSTPGVSDLDVVVIADDDTRIDLDPRSGMSEDQLYLFAHALYAVPLKLLKPSQAFTAFHNYRLLHGPDVIGDTSDKLPCQEVKIQTALEFLLRMFIVTEFESEIGISKVRSLLLHAKGLNYDFEFLGISDGPLYDQVQQMIGWRNRWFDDQPSKSQMIGWLSSFREELNRSLSEILQNHELRLPPSANQQYSRSIRMQTADQLAFRSTGFKIPRVFQMMPRLYIKLVNRICKFEADVPMTDRMTRVLDQRFSFLRELKEYNDRYLPAFYPMGTSLGLI